MSEWSIPLDKLADKYKADLEQVARKSTFDLFNAVNLRTPVDTGRFRANWNVSYNAPDYAITESTNQSRANSEISKVLSLPVGGVIYLCNGLPYGRHLEYGLYPSPVKRGTYNKKTKSYEIRSSNGYSKQAPSGMIRISVREYRDYVNRAIK